MNIDPVKEEIKAHLNCRVKVEVYGLRNKNFSYVGTISSVYPAIFTVNVDGETKSFNYVDVIIGEVKLTYL